MRYDLIKSQTHIDNISFELKKLKEKDAAEYRRLRVSSEYFSEEAAIAQACRQPFNINTCPKSLTDIGDQAIKNLYSGGQQSVFWLIYIAKLFLVMIVFLAPLVFLVNWWSRRIKPNLEAFSTMEQATLAGESALSAIRQTVAAEEQKLTAISKEIATRVLILKKQRKAFEDMKEELATLKLKSKSIADDNDLLKAFTF